MKELSEQIKEIIVCALGAQINVEEIGVDEPLMDDNIGLDSITILEIIAGLEDAFDITVEDEDIVEELFGSVRSLEKYVLFKLESNSKNPVYA